MDGSDVIYIVISIVVAHGVGTGRGHDYDILRRNNSNDNYLEQCLISDQKLTS